MKTNETEEIKMLKPLNGYAYLNEKITNNVRDDLQKFTQLCLVETNINKIATVSKAEKIPSLTCNLPATSPCWLMIGV